MDPITLLLSAIVREPGDDLAWLALSDGLEEAGQTERAELTRLTRRLLLLSRDAPERVAMEPRLQAMLLEGVCPCVPQMTNSAGIRFVLVPPGRFMMGSPADEPDRDSDEGPLHEVAITQGFWMSERLVTAAEWDRVTRHKRNWQYAGSDRPAHNITFKQAEDFCFRLSARKTEQAAGRSYRLPTEAEWEWACRAGTSSAFHFGASLPPGLAHVEQIYADGPPPGGQHPPNAWGLHDMHGHLYAWCRDWHDYEYYRYSPIEDPQGPESGTHRVLRTCCWVDRAYAARCASRNRTSPTDRNPYQGLRLVCPLRPA